VSGFQTWFRGHPPGQNGRVRLTAETRGRKSNGGANVYPAFSMSAMGLSLASTTSRVIDLANLHS
jgi:hypothetical protein